MGDDSVELTYAYIDELIWCKRTGSNINPADDDKFGLMTALLFPADMHEAAIAKFTPGFEKFRNAAPTGAKLHFTDAYLPAMKLGLQ